MSARTAPPFRYDHVGSLLRPDSLLACRDQWNAGEITLEELRVHEDACIKEVVKLQEEWGLKAVTDGEFRRESFHVDFIGKIKNVSSSWDLQKAIKVGEDHTAGINKQMPYIPYINGKIDRPDGGIEIANYRYTRSLTDLPVKTTIPSPTMTHFRGGSLLETTQYAAIDYRQTTLAQQFTDFGYIRFSNILPTVNPFQHTLRHIDSLN